MEPKGGTSISSPRGPQSSNLSYQVDKPFILKPTCLWWKCFLSERTENSGWRAALKDQVWKTTKHFWWPDHPQLFISTLANSHIVLRRKNIPPRFFWEPDVASISMKCFICMLHGKPANNLFCFLATITDGFCCGGGDVWEKQLENV